MARGCDFTAWDCMQVYEKMTLLTWLITSVDSFLMTFYSQLLVSSFGQYSVMLFFFHLPEKEHLCRGIALPVHGRSTLLSKISHFWIQKPKMVNGLAFQSATRNNSKRFALVTLTHSKTQSYTGGRGCHASCQPAHQEQLGFHYLAQGYLDMQPGQSGDLTTDLTISGWLVPPPESQLPLLDYYLLWLVP